MKESCDEGLATHVGPESCIGVREEAGEALTGEPAGWVLSSEILNLWSADAVFSGGRPQRAERPRELHQCSTESETPGTQRRISHGSREIPGLPLKLRGRVENPQGATRR